MVDLPYRQWQWLVDQKDLTAIEFQQGFVFMRTNRVSFI
jgi:hypothetical protein